MSDYIKRDDAIKHNESQVNFCKQEGFPNPEWLHIDSIKNNIKLIPAADVVEQKHGKWIMSITEPVVGRICSNCGFAWSTQIAAVRLQPAFSNIKTAYCPNCGARMDGDS